MTLELLMQWPAGALVAILGAIVGSFLNVCIWRLPRNLSVVLPASHCPRCKTKIPFYDNIPILGFFLLRGRCRFCGTPFSPRYAIVEALTALIAWLLWWSYAPTLLLLAYFVFLAAMIVVFFVDIDLRIIPDEISLGGAVVGWLAALLFPLCGLSWFCTLSQATIGIAMGAGLLWLVSWVYRQLTGNDGIGMGDVKLLGMMGSWFGLQTVLLTIFVSSLLGSFMGLAMMLKYGRSAKYPIPFGPFIVVGCILSLYWGRPILELVFGNLESSPLASLLRR